jgi:hypothetical protein
MAIPLIIRLRIGKICGFGEVPTTDPEIAVPSCEGSCFYQFAIPFTIDHIRAGSKDRDCLSCRDSTTGAPLHQHVGLTR